jgi:hypothetical protein
MFNIKHINALLLAATIAFLQRADSFHCNPSPARQPTRMQSSSSAPSATSNKKNILPDSSDVIIIGSGLAGLSCAALLAHCGRSVTVLESHDAPGGCCHTWERQGFHFESGPSLYSGFSNEKVSTVSDDAH